MERIARVPAATGAPTRGSKRLLALRSDAALVERVRVGDEAAFEVLYERHAAPVLGYCRHTLGSQQEAEDAVQQAFVSAHDAMHRGSREIAFKPWLYTIARNRCLSMLRARREQPAELPELSTAGLNEQVERRADLRELLTDLQRLPEHQRAALVLSELGDLSHAEIAAVIGCEPHSVKGLVFRARSALAERRDARAADCSEIRLELASAKRGPVRPKRLRYHLDTCPDCAAYLDEVRRQRKLLGIALPIVPTLALRDGVMSSVGIGATAGSAATLIGGTAVKLAVTGAIVAGGAGIATEVVEKNGNGPPAQAPPTVRQEHPGSGAQPEIDAAAPPAKPAKRAPERRRGGERNGPGQQLAGPRRAQPETGRAHGKALGRDRGTDVGPGIGKAVRRQPPPNLRQKPKGQRLGGGRGAGTRKNNAAPPAPAPPPAGNGTDRGDRPRQPSRDPLAGPRKAPVTPERARVNEPRPPRSTP